MVGGPRLVVERDEVALRVERAAHLERERRPLGIPRGFLVAASTARAPAGRSPSPETPPRTRHRRPPCGRTPAVLPSRRRARDRAASRGTARRRCACRTTSCRSSRSSSDRSTDRPSRARDRTPCGPGTARRIPLRRPSPRRRTPASGFPTTTGGALKVGVAPRMYVNRSSDAGNGAVAGFCQLALSCRAALMACSSRSQTTAT